MSTLILDIDILYPYPSFCFPNNDSIKILGSERELALFEISAIYAFGKKTSIKPSINFGLNDDTPDFGLAISFSWRL